MEKAVATKKPLVTTFELTLIAIFGAATCIIAPMSIPIGPVPISMSVFIAILCGALLTPKAAFFSQLVRIILGAVGVPVWAGFQGGAQYLVGPLAGYVIATPFMALGVALVAGWCAKNKDKPRMVKLVALFASGVAVLAFDYLLGTVWFCVVTGTGFIAALAVCVVPFIVLDLLKILAVTLIWGAVGMRLRRQFNY